MVSFLVYLYVSIYIHLSVYFAVYSLIRPTAGSRAWWGLECRFFLSFLYPQCLFTKYIHINLGAGLLHICLDRHYSCFPILLPRCIDHTAVWKLNLCLDTTIGMLLNYVYSISFTLTIKSFNHMILGSLVLYHTDGLWFSIGVHQSCIYLWWWMIIYRPY